MKNIKKGIVSLTAAGSLLTGGAYTLGTNKAEAATVQQQALTSSQAVSGFKALYPGYSVRYDHTDSKGNYVIQVCQFYDNMTHTLDWFTVNSKTQKADAMFNPKLSTYLHIKTAAQVPTPAPVQKIIKGKLYHWTNSQLFNVETFTGFIGFHTTNTWYLKNLKMGHVYTFYYTTDKYGHNNIVKINY
ncbi:hypothetical protein [Neobacillus cucumis]|uniref:hypothetical protein n=1 Tax=Neobacillus cucumis TaxID=1740721 RepID=UPI0028534E2A|nr:hypothetical protein [Neobacillus cucumis]MDR4950396.1 hypothetical protein [Neobacillus cucumis]